MDVLLYENAVLNNEMDNSCPSAYFSLPVEVEESILLENTLSSTSEASFKHIAAFVICGGIIFMLLLYLLLSRDANSRQEN